MVSEEHRLTYDDYLNMPDGGQRYEIIHGALLVTTPPSRTHQEVLLPAILDLRCYLPSSLPERVTYRVEEKARRHPRVDSQTIQIVATATC